MSGDDADLMFSAPLSAAQVVRGIRAKDFIIEVVDQSVIDTASTLFDPQASKHNTFFDAIVAAVAQKLNATAVFSFDGWYEKIGLKLVANVA